MRSTCIQEKRTLLVNFILGIEVENLARNKLSYPLLFFIFELLFMTAEHTYTYTGLASRVEVARFSAIIVVLELIHHTRKRIEKRCIYT